MDYLRGYKIKLRNGEWIFCDTGKPTVETWKERPCGHCGLFNTPEGHDGCLGTLEGVMNACCGHGENRCAYVQFEDQSIIQGEEAINYFVTLKELPCFPSTK